MADGASAGGYLSVLGAVILVMLGFMLFFVSFLLAPILVIAIIYFMLRLGDRSVGAGAAPAQSVGARPVQDRGTALAREREARRRALAGNGHAEQTGERVDPR